LRREGKGEGPFSSRRLSFLLSLLPSLYLNMARFRKIAHFGELEEYSAAQFYLMLTRFQKWSNIKNK